MNNKIKATAMDSVVELSPKVKRQRSTFNLPIKNYTSFNVGELVPIDFTEVLPGDTFNVNLNSFIRLTSTTKRPPMDNLHMDIYAVFCPYRFLDDSWVNIQGENPAPWAISPGSCSQFNLPAGAVVAAGSLLNHLGFPIFQTSSDSGYDPDKLTFNIYPVLTYYKIINDWFRDENLQYEIPYDTTNGTYSASSDLPTINGKYIYEKGGLFKVAKYHDVFTSALPSPQKGPSVGLLANGTAPVGVISNTDLTINGNRPTGNLAKSLVNGKFGQLELTNGSSTSYGGLIADLSQSMISTINELRLAFQLQKAYELDARSGTRYVEAVEARFSVKNPDLRLGRTELLGHYRFDLSMAEMTSTTAGGTTGATVADLKGSSYINGVGAGASKTGNSQHICVKSFTEHGIFMILGCVRPDLTYQQGLEKFWRKKDRFAFYEPIFSNIGEVPIMASELTMNGVGTADNGWDVDSVFGYQEAWYEYRYKQSHISGILASDSNEGFDIFHYGIDFGAGTPIISSSFIEQSNASVNRTLAFDSSVVDNFIGQFEGVIKATRVMPLFSVPGLIDHF